MTREPLAAAPELRKRLLRMIPKALISIALLAMAFSSVDAAGAVSVLTALPAWAWLLGALLLVAQLPQLALRWVLVLRASRLEIKYADAATFTFIGYFFNQVLPTSVGGDVMRAYLAWRGGIGFRPALTSVFLERASGMALLVLFSFLLLRHPPVPLNYGFDHHDVLLLVGFVSILGMALVAGLARLTEGVQSENRAAQLLADLGQQFQALIAAKSILSAVVLLGATSAVTGACSVFLAAKVLGLPLDFYQVLGITSLAIVLTVIPISVAGWGVREFVLIWLMTPLGVPPETALGISIWFGLVSILAAIPGGLLWLKPGSARQTNVLNGQGRR